jgi:hypothetical protein
MSMKSFVSGKENLKYKPINQDNVVMINNYTYLERVDHRIRLVTTEYEMFY